MPVVFVWDFQNKIAEVQLPDTVLELQDFVNQVRDVEDSLTAVDGFLPMTYPSIMTATGKAFLSPAKRVGITVEMLDEQGGESGWKIKFADRAVPTVVEIRGGNLALVESDGLPPVEFATNTMPVIEGDTSAALVQQRLGSIS